MLLIKQLNKTSTKRFQVKHRFLHKHLSEYRRWTTWVKKNNLKYKGSIGILHTKFKKKTELHCISSMLNLKTPFVINNYGNFTTKLREFSLIKNLYNQVSIVNQTAVFYPGFILYPLPHLYYLEEVKKLVGQFIPLLWIPINLPVSYIYNSLNTKVAFIKSAGSVGIRKKLHRKVKLIGVQLPSQQVKLFSLNRLCMFASTLNLEANKIVEGGWGYFPKNKKILRVRGVAKNPVDHPNGGRTKAKQPEMSPWGWIAKHNK